MAQKRLIETKIALAQKPSIEFTGGRDTYGTSTPPKIALIKVVRLGGVCAP